MFDGTFDSIINKPITLGGYGITDSSHGRWNELTNTPTTLLGYGITDAVGPMHVAYGINQDNIENWNNAYHYSLIDQSQFFKDINWLPTWADVLDKPDFSTLGGGGGGGTSIHGLLTGLDYTSSGHTGFVSSVSYTAADVFSKVLTLDGHGTGLDADKLDSQHGSWYAPITSPTFLTSAEVTGFFRSSGRIIAGGLVSLHATALIQAKIDTSIGYQNFFLFKAEDNSVYFNVSNGSGAGGYFPVFTGKTVSTTLPALWFVGNSSNGTNTAIIGFDGRVNDSAASTTDILIGFSTGYGNYKTKIYGNGDFYTVGGCEITGSSLFNGLVKTNGGVHIGGSSDPGAGNLIVHGTTSPSILNYGGLVKSNYVSQLTGYRISNAGEADFRYLYADQLHVKSFIADLEQALAGGQIIAKSVAKVATDFTIPAAGGTATLVVEEFAEFVGAVFVNGDVIRLRKFSRADNTTLVVADVWGTVIYLGRNYTVNPTTQSYTFTRSAAPNAGGGSGIVKTGTLALDYGTSGQGYYETTAVDGINGANSPYSQIVTWTGHPATGSTLKMRSGNLSGITDVDFGGALSGYGLYSDNVYLKGKIVIASGSSGYSNITDKPTLGTLAALNNVTWGTNINSIPTRFTDTIPPTGTGLQMTSTYLGFYDTNVWKTYIDNAGNMVLGDPGLTGNGLYWNQGTGVLSIKGAINITNTIPYGSVSGTPTIPTNTNQLTDGANLGGTSTWAGTSGKPTFGSLATQSSTLFNTPSGAGLYMDGTHLGYYDGGAWNSYFDSSGNSKFVGVTEFGTGTANYGSGKDWNIAIKGSDIWENTYYGDLSYLYINRKSQNGGSLFTRGTFIGDGQGRPAIVVMPSNPFGGPNLEIIQFGSNSGWNAYVENYGKLWVQDTTTLNGSLIVNNTITSTGTMVNLGGAHNLAASTGDITCTVAENDMSGMSITLTPKGNKILIMFGAPFRASNTSFTLIMNAGGTNVRTTKHYCASGQPFNVSFQHLLSVTAGSSITIKMRWSDTTSAWQYGSTDAIRELTVVDLM